MKKSNHEFYLQKIRKNNGFKAQYVSEVVRYNQIKDKQINLIEAPCGTGKTTFLIDKVVSKARNKERIVLLVDTCALEESLLFKYKEYLKPYISSFSNTMMHYEKSDDRYGFGVTKEEFIPKDNRAFCMTYSKFSSIILNTPDDEFFDNIKFLCCDEVHHLVTYMSYEDVEKKQTKLYKALEKIISAAMKGVFKTLLITATPDNIIQLLKEDFNCECVKLAGSNDLRGHLFNEQIVFSDIGNILNNLKKDDSNSFQKYLIYIERIGKSLEAKKILEQNGFEVASLWSINNLKQMDTKSLATREHIIKYEEIPENIDVVIINAAYETGYNIYDKDRKVQTVIVNSRKSDIITQVRGRIRHDIDSLITLDQNEKGLVSLSQSSVEFNGANLDEFIGTPLTTVQKEKLVMQLNLKNQNGRIKKWTSIKNILLANDYLIEGTFVKINGKPTRVDIIIRPQPHNCEESRKFEINKV